LNIKEQEYITAILYKDNMKRTEIAHIMILLILGIGELWLGYSVWKLQVAATRADISILVNPHNQNWTFVLNGGYLTINGTLRNEGSRAAMIKELQLSALYHFPNDDIYMLRQLYFVEDLDWNDNIIVEEELRSFSLTMYIQRHDVIDSITQQSIEIGNSRSDEFAISVTYYDGEGDVTEEEMFSAES